MKDDVVRLAAGIIVGYVGFKAAACVVRITVNGINEILITRRFKKNLKEAMEA